MVSCGELWVFQVFTLAYRRVRSGIGQTRSAIFDGKNVANCGESVVVRGFFVAVSGYTKESINTSAFVRSSQRSRTQTVLDECIALISPFQHRERLRLPRLLLCPESSG